MKKYLPFILVVVAATVLVGGFLIVKKITQPVSTDMSQDDGSVADFPQDQKPVAALVPTSDGHYLTLKVDGIKVPNATSMDYDLLWKANNSGTLTPQGTSDRKSTRLNSSHTVISYAVFCLKKKKKKNKKTQ